MRAQGTVLLPRKLWRKVVAFWSGPSQKSFWYISMLQRMLVKTVSPRYKYSYRHKYPLTFRSTLPFGKPLHDLEVDFYSLSAVALLVSCWLGC